MCYKIIITLKIYVYNKWHLCKIVSTSINNNRSTHITIGIQN